MPLRMLIDSGAVEPDDVALVGARNLDPPEEEYVRSHRVHVGAEGVAGALDGTAGSYVAFDADSVAPGELTVFMPEEGGLRLTEVEQLFADLRERTLVVGAGFTGLAYDEANVEPLTRVAQSLGL
jgi:arginase